jgi:hypothetical protein
MGQATLDLPDPLEQPPESAAGTDDLLAQLAGEEIDRLLAETDNDSVAADSPQNSVQAQEPLLPPVSAVAQSADKAEVEEEPSAQLGKYLGQIASQTPDDPIPSAPKPVFRRAADPDSHREAAIDKLTSEAEEFEDDATLAAAERGALNLAEEAPVDTAVVVETDAQPEVDVESQSRPPIFIRVLAWLNSPLDSLPDETRELIGKIAILTTINALSVLVYVLFFRRHG